MLGHAYLCGLLIMVLGKTGYGLERNRRDDAPQMKVTTIEEQPYVMLSGKDSSGNDKFKGFIPDLLSEISKKIQVGYEMHLVVDSQYGQLQSGDNWSGMVGELQRKKVDLAAAALTMSPKRKMVIDFTEPFMDVGLSVLYKKPEDGMEPPFNSLEGLTEETGLDYGVVKGGNTENFLQTSSNETLRNIWDKIQKSSAGSRSLTNKNGEQMVRDSDGKFVFIMESTTADYYKNQRPCELDTLHIGNHNQYAFGIKKGSEYKTRINDAMKELRENGKIEELKNKWWKGDCGPGGTGNSLHTTMTSASLVLLGAFLYFLL